MGRTFRWFALLAMSASGCVIGFDEYQAVCEPGTEEACYSGPDGTKDVGPCKGGVRTCKPDGSGYGACAGEVTPVAENCATDLDDDCNGVTLDATAGCVCKPGTQETCYSGLPGTEGVGPCKGGIHVCDATGKSYDACDEITPQPEDCSTDADEDCDGETLDVEAGCMCKPGTEAACSYSGPAGTEGVGICKVAMQVCDATGKSYGACTGEVVPQGEQCNTPAVDENCDDKPTCTGAHLWSKRFGDAKGQFGYTIAVDGADNIVLAGVFDDSVDFGGGKLTSADQIDIFVAKLDSQLNHLWSKSFAGADSQSVSGIAADGAGNVVLTGYYHGSVDFGAGVLTSAGNSGNPDIFVAKLDPQLNHLWSKSFGDADAQAGASVAVDGAGNVVLTGNFYGSVDFGGGPLTSAGGADIFVAKFDSQLNHLWSKRFGDADNQGGAAIAFDGGGNVVLTGNVFGSVDFGGGPLTSAGAYDIFVAKLDSQLNHLSSKRFGDADQDNGASIAIDGMGNVVLTGYFRSSIDFGGGSLISGGDQDIFVAKLDPQLNHLWSKSFGTADIQSGTSIAVDGAGNVVLTGRFFGSVDFGGGPLTSAGAQDIFVAKLDPEFNHAWSNHFGDSEYEYGNSVVTDGAGNVVLTGFFLGSVDFGGGVLTSVGQSDIFVAKLAP